MLPQLTQVPIDDCCEKMPPRKRQKATRLIAWPGRDAAPLHERSRRGPAEDLRVYPKTVQARPGLEERRAARRTREDIPHLDY